MVIASKKITLLSDNRIKLSIDGYDNIININGVDYEMKYLGDNPGNKGGNSNVLKLQLVGIDYEDEAQEEYVIKISKIPLNAPYSKFNKNRKARFQREILALRKANRNWLPNVVKLIDYGIIKIEEKEFSFYTMEKANSDLNDYLIPRRTIQQKVFLFQSILEGIKQLHGIQIYHRDIKHDNVFMFGDECKIGDLGLMRFKDEDNLALDKEQRIGAFGWETPEAMNKFLTENKPDPEFYFDCNIDEASDIFQLGKLFWYILQGNIPIGCLHITDFKIEDPELFNVLIKLLQHGKSQSFQRRPLNITAVEQLIEPIAKKYLVA
jgi:serine/threonine protein kinase